MHAYGVGMVCSTAGVVDSRAECSQLPGIKISIAPTYDK